jgi:hypothetical protein
VHLLKVLPALSFRRLYKATVLFFGKEIVKMKKNDITFIRSTIYFVTLSKFKIMETEDSKKEGQKMTTSKNGVPPSDITDKNFGRKQIAELMNNFKNVHGFQNALCFFLKAVDLNTLMSIPNFQGLSVYNGNENGEDVLIVVPVRRASDPQNVYNQTTVTNGDTTTTSTVAKVGGSPCPPLPPHMSTCP